MIFRSFILAFFAILVGCASIHKVTAQPQILSITKKMETVVTQGQAPAVAGLLIQTGKIEHLSAFGVRAIHRPEKVTVNDVWHLGSDTKAMTAFLIALAVQDGYITYDTNVADFLEFKNVHKAFKDLTLGDLLTHRSRLQDFLEPLKDEELKAKILGQSDLKLQRWMISEAAFQLPPLQEKAPGEFSYANINYIALGAVLEKIHQEPWETSMAVRLFRPLKMKSCGFGVAGESKEKIPSQPWPHIFVEGKLHALPPETKADNLPLLGPAGTVHCSLTDWNLFIQELMSGQSGLGKLMYDPKVAKKYFQTSDDKSDYTFGGWGRRQSKDGLVFYAHSGSNTFNYASAAFSFDTNKALFMVMNSAYKPSVIVFEQVFNDLMESFLLSR